jgi:cysteinyl-tRNA synthetase
VKAKADLAAKKVSQEVAGAFLDESKDTLANFLDGKLKHTVTDPKIFRDFAAHWENEFFKDMDALNVRLFYDGLGQAFSCLLNGALLAWVT